MKIFNKIKNYIYRHNLSRDERKRLENQDELEEYNARQEKYNDMIRDEMQRQKFLNKMSTIKKTTYTKKMVAVILFMAIFDIQLAYVLAFFDKAQGIDNLTNQLCTTILGVAFIYMVRAYFDSRAEHQNMDEQIKDELKEKLSAKIDDTFSAAGINVSAEEFLNKPDESKFSLPKNFSININTNNNSEQEC